MLNGREYQKLKMAYKCLMFLLGLIVLCAFLYAHYYMLYKTSVEKPLYLDMQNNDFLVSLDYSPGLCNYEEFTV
jgi:hypothetical protein